jgi:hypothetical protein
MEILEGFLKSWEKQYNDKNKSIDLFDRKKTKNLTKEQKRFFANAFYHARGHFYRFLWYIGSYAQNEAEKQVVLDNIKEEFGGSLDSHEQLYIEFAKALGGDVNDEIITERTNLPFIKEFNKAHVDWLMTHDWDSKWAAFSAYERLDNVDYENLYLLAESFGLKGKPLVFFEVHREVEHYEHASHLLQKIWDNNPESVKAAFKFIGENQIHLWEELSDAVFEI